MVIITAIKGFFLKGNLFTKFAFIVIGFIIFQRIMRYINNFFANIFAGGRVREFEETDKIRALKIRSIIDEMAERESGWINTGFSIVLKRFTHYQDLLRLADKELIYASDYWRSAYSNVRPFKGKTLKQQSSRGSGLSSKRPYAGHLIKRLENLNL